MPVIRGESQVPTVGSVYLYSVGEASDHFGQALPPIVAIDAEQVIVATAERPDTQTYPRITYTSGSIEHSDNSDGIGTH